jgi:hypothetical protein
MQYAANSKIQQIKHIARGYSNISMIFFYLCGLKLWLPIVNG